MPIFLLALLFAMASLRVAEASAPANAGTPRRGGTLQLRFTSDFRSMDPAIAFDADSNPLNKLLFRGLLNFGDGTDLVPDQASDWSVSPDGKTYQFQLRPGVKFSHGREVEAADYVCALERVLNPKTGSPGQSYFLDIVGAPEFAAGRATNVAGLRAPDARTLIIELAKPSFTFRYLMTMNFAAPVPRELVSRYGAEFQYHLEGSGPYRMTEWRRDVSWRFERNPHYSGSDGWVDAVQIMIGGDSMVGIMMVERGEIDRASATASTRLRYQRDPRLRSWLHQVVPCNTVYLFLNTEMKPFDDVRVRQAMNYAIDRPRLIKLAAGECIEQPGIVPESMPWSNPSRPRYDYDPEKARALLSEAGFPDGFTMELWYMSTRKPDDSMAQGIQQDLRRVGITVDLKTAAYSSFLVKTQTRRQVACGLFGWYQDYPDPSTYLDTVLNGERITDTDCNNIAFYNNPEVNRRVTEAARIIDPERRLQLFREAENIVMQDAPWVPLFTEQLNVICHPRLRGDVPHPVWLWRYEHMWLAE